MIKFFLYIYILKYKFFKRKYEWRKQQSGGNFAAALLIV